MDHRPFRELAAGAALDDLKPIETATLVGHLATCAACRRDSIALADVVGLVGLATGLPATPAGYVYELWAADATGGAVTEPGPQVVFGNL